MGFFTSRSRKSGERSKTQSGTTSSTHSSSEPRSPESRQLHRQEHDNRSTSNLSTTSTLNERPTQKTSRPQPPARLSSYEIFLQQARKEDRERVEREKRVAHAWEKAAERRRNAWPVDPWRGGFGPPTGHGGMAPRGEVDRSVRGWLGQNGLVRH